MKEKHRVLVTGFGIVSPIGNGAGETLAGLRAGRDGVSPVTAFDVSKTRCKTAGQVNDDWLKDVFPSNRRTQRLRRSSRMVAAALVEAMSMAGAMNPELVVFSTSVGEVIRPL